MAISLSALNRARAAAEADMRDKCVITVSTGEKTWNPDRLVEEDLRHEIYSGKCELKYSDTVSKTAAGITVEGYTLKLPATAAPLAIGALVTLTESFSDPAMSGQAFEISKLALGSHLVARRYRVALPSGPDG